MGGVLIRITCTGCGEVELLPEDVTVRVFEAIDPQHSWCSYRFLCPSCDHVVEGTASGHAATWLLRAGVPHYVEHVPDEAREPHAGAPFTEEDIQELLVELDDENLEWRDAGDMGS